MKILIRFFYFTRVKSIRNLIHNNTSEQGVIKIRVSPGKIISCKPQPSEDCRSFQNTNTSILAASLVDHTQTRNNIGTSSSTSIIILSPPTPNRNNIDTRSLSSSAATHTNENTNTVDKCCPICLDTISNVKFFFHLFFIFIVYFM